MNKRYKYILLSFLPTISIFVVTNLLSFFYVQLLLLYDVWAAPQSEVSVLQEMMIEQIQSLEFNITLSVSYMICCSLIFVFCYRFMKRQLIPDYDVRNLKKDRMELRPKNSLMQYSPWVIPGILLLALGTQLVGIFVMDVVSLYMPQWFISYQEIMQAGGYTKVTIHPILLLCAIVLAPITEELAFRGLTYSLARRFMPFWGAVIFQSILFAGMHGNWLQAIYTFIFAMLIGYVYGRCRNIAIPILVHMCFNAYSFFMPDSFFGVSAPFFFVMLLLTFFCIYAGINMMIKSIPPEVNDFYSPSYKHSVR